jgi:hypothetical protein
LGTGAAALATFLLLGGCKTTPSGDYIQFHAGRDPASTAGHLSDKIGACWFNGKRKAFEGYSYAPEAGMSSTRILIVPQSAPHDLPVLIVEVIKAKRGTDVRLFGPLMQGNDADAIRRDIMRWTGGARDC